MSGANATRKAILGKLAALALRVTEPTIGNWRAGHYSPDPGSRCVIERWTDGYVRVEQWETEAEKARIKYANGLEPYGTETKTKRRTR